ncbi:tripartite tricarboxylate transporter substrate binding protein [Ammoniphilus resinae]|uniref:Tripartite-type tricarboxylate transporter receptor subunit TctC n=1 Tax=Ammoniphilus resinae TaxID=861532 RepID=A0ABS4GQY1_9BACL|nr:tripartite tricarboxylate transporter substrate binding protein [Ammoniphilus resinae]MBP1932685.1 tripartite-type tricarboxylate transporter receptor subunit TctC [Ammoniphilus resinae]
MVKGSWRKWVTSAAVAGMLALTACGGGSTNTSSGGGNNAQPENKQAEAPAPAPEKKSDFPNKAVTLLVPHAAGGGTDATARALAKEAEQFLGQSIAVINKTGGGGAVGFTEGANAKPDGYLVTMVTVEIASLHHLNLTPLTYEAYTPIAQINYDPATITVKADAPWNTVKEFIEYAKAHPGEVKMGNSGPGSIWHLSAAAVEKDTGVKFNHVPFDGAAPAVTALLGGHIDAVPVSPAEVKAQVEAGKLKTLAILDEKPSDALPGVKTWEEEMGSKTTYLGPWRGLVVPKGTPDDAVQVLTDAFMKAAESDGFKEYMKNNGLGIDIKDGPGFEKLMQDSDKNFGELIPALGLVK